MMLPDRRRLVLTRQVLGATTWILAAVVLGLGCAIANLRWYAALRHPAFQPPPLTFGLIWVAAQGAVLWALFRVLCSPDWMPDRAAAMWSFLTQAGFVAAWPVMVFALHRPRLGLVILVCILVTGVITARLFGLVDRLAGVVLLPYLAWMAFVLFLNASLMMRN